MRVWERGWVRPMPVVRERAAVVAGFHLQNKSDASVLLRGGQLLIDYDVMRKVSKQGPAQFVFSSEVTI